MSLLHLKNQKYFELNNKINIPIKVKGKDGKMHEEIPLKYDKEALKAFYKENVNPNMVHFNSLRERFQWLIKHNYYERGFIEKYPFSFIEKIYHYLNSQHFHFGSFVSALKFYNQYAMRTNDNAKYLESYIDRLAVNALYLGNGNQKLAMNLAHELINQRYQPATPTFLNVGRKRRGQFVSCYLIQTTDNMNTIGRTINSALQLSKIGGGVGINLTNLRCAGDPIKGIAGAASGVVPVMKLLEDSFSYSNQLGQRQGAGAVYLNIFHPDIKAFLSTKKENADEKVRVKTLSLGCIVPDVFYKLCREDKDMYTFSPYDVSKYYHKDFAYVNITKHYNEMLKNPKIRKPSHFPARQLETEISELQQESGYPYVMNIDTANKNNYIPGYVAMSNLCSEIMQVQKPSVVNDDQSFAKMGTDISCNLGSTNIANVMTSPSFKKSIETDIFALSNVSDDVNVPTVPPVQKCNHELHAIGMGAMGLASYLAKSHIMYGSKVALDFTRIYFMMLRYYALDASNKIAMKKHETFYGFKKSGYADGRALARFTRHNWQPKYQHTKELFKHYHIPTQKDWQKLDQRIRRHGIYNAYQLAVAPNSSTSYLGDATSSLYPPASRAIETRYESKLGSTMFPMPFLSKDTLPYYKSAYDIDMRKQILTFAMAQKSVDQSLACTLFMKSKPDKGMYEWKDHDITPKMTTRDLSILRNFAHKCGLKSLYYVRTYTEDHKEVNVNECKACEV